MSRHFLGMCDRRRCYFPATVRLIDERLNPCAACYAIWSRSESEAATGADIAATAVVREQSAAVGRAVAPACTQHADAAPRRPARDSDIALALANGA